MCGIAGSTDARIDVPAMLARIKHRGPDGSGVKTLDSVVHGHVRLALVDLSDAAAQPFQTSGLLSFVGEIWNYRELRADLHGHCWRSSGDTEVLAVLLGKYSLAALERLEGMFSLVWTYAGETFLVRDRFGKVPLYVQKTKNGYAWASEKKAFASMSGIASVPPGHYFDVRRGVFKRWYSIPELPDEISDVISLLEDGVRYRLAADAPVCCLVSGGLDSSLILALALRHTKQIICYTAYHDEASADLVAARLICKYFSVQLVEVKVDQLSAELLSEAVRVIEFPMETQVEIAALCIPLAKRISLDGFKACLSGEGADELFGGYRSTILAAHGQGDDGWKLSRRLCVEKMARGNFLRCDKSFMSHGVECRLPFMHRSLVEKILSLGKENCPQDKALLKKSAEAILPSEIVYRKKETFQGGAGVISSVEKIIANPVKFYNAEARRYFGAMYDV